MGSSSDLSHSRLTPPQSIAHGFLFDNIVPLSNRLFVCHNFPRPTLSGMISAKKHLDFSILIAMSNWTSWPF